MRATTIVVMVTAGLLAAILIPTLTASRGARLLTLYHYTNRAGVDGIRTSNMIRRSTRPTLHYGPGVYFTPLSPEAGKRAVGMACYGTHYGRMAAAGRLDYAVVVTIPAGEVEEVRHNVFVHRADLDLDDYRPRFITCRWPAATSRQRNTRRPRQIHAE